MMKMTLFLIVISGAFLFCSMSFASYNNEDFSFSSFGQKELELIDLNKLTESSKLKPGAYFFDLYLNGEFLTQKNVKLFNINENQLVPCINTEILSLLGLNEESVTLYYNEVECVDIEKSIPNAKLNIDTSQLKIKISIPNLYIKSRPRGYISPELFNYGIAGLKTNYNLNSYYQRNNNSGDGFGGFLSLNNTFNYEEWRLTNFSTFTWDDTGHKNWENVRNYVQRDIFSMHSQLTFGDNFTSGELFPSVGFRGASIRSNEQMLPSSQLGYAPIIRGIARSQAKVTIRQNGYIIYETNVPAGEFLINDLYPTGYDGNLTVSITEVNGKVQEYSVPYASVPNLLRPGRVKYSSTVGKVRTGSMYYSPLFGELTLQYGISNNVTSYAGLQLVEDNQYRSSILGFAFNTPVGSFSIDSTFSDTNSISGYSLRGTYSKNFVSTGTDFVFSSYKHSSQDFMSLSDYINLKSNKVQFNPYPEKNKLQMTLSQRFKEGWGNISFSGVYSEMWEDSYDSYNYQVSYNNQFKNISYGLTASQINYNDGSKDTQFYLNFSVPLDSFSNSGNSLTSSFSVSDNNKNVIQTGLSGSNENQAISYNIAASFIDKDENKFDTSLNWIAPYTNMGVNYSFSEQAQRTSLELHGGALVHSKGVTFSHDMGETVGLAYINGGEGAKVGINKVNKSGYGVIANLNPYKVNTIAVSPADTSLNLEINKPIRQIVPTSGAIVYVPFETTYGHAVLISTHLKNSDGVKLPLASSVFDKNKKEVGMVGQDGTIFARVKDNSGILEVKFSTEEKSCYINYDITDEIKLNKKLIQISTPCG